MHGTWNDLISVHQSGNIDSFRRTNTSRHGKGRCCA
jgi:hypothetical protein